MSLFEKLKEENPDFNDEELRNVVLEYMDPVIAEYSGEPMADGNPDAEDPDVVLEAVSEYFGMPDVVGGFKDTQTQDAQSEKPYIKDGMVVDLLGSQVRNSQEVATQEENTTNIIHLKDVAEEVGIPSDIPVSEETFGSAAVNMNEQEVAEKRDATIQSFLSGAQTLPAGSGVLLEDAFNYVHKVMDEDATEEEMFTYFNDWAKENKDKISEANKKLGVEGDFFTPDLFGKLGAEIATIPLAGLKAIRGIGWLKKHPIFSASVAGGTLAGVSELGEDKTYAEAGQSAVIATAGGYMIGKLGVVGAEALGKMFRAGNGRLFKMVVSEHGMNKAEVDSILDNYGKTIGKDVSDMDWNDKTRALMLGSEKASSTMQHMMREDPELSGAMIDGFRAITENFTKNLKGKDMNSLRFISKRISKDIKIQYDEFHKIIDDHYSDIKIYLQTPGQQKKLIDFINSDTISDEMKKSLHNILVKANGEGGGSISDLRNFRTLLNEQASKYAGKGELSSSSLSKEYSDISKEISKLIDDKTPEILLPMKNELDTLYRQKKIADEAELFTLFQNINMKPSDVKKIQEAMKAMPEGSSYSTFIKAIGNDSKYAEAFENAIVESFTNPQLKDGVAIFQKISENIKDIKFKTPHGKALKEVIDQYSEVYRNIADKASNVQVKPDAQGLTMNPLIKLAYESSASLYTKIKTLFALSKPAKARYIMTRLPDVLKNNNMPQGLSIVEQGNVASYANLMKSLKDFSSKTSEEIESGFKKGYDSSFMFGQERLGKQGFTKADIDSGLDTFKKTGWYHDKVDDRWKFHIKDSEYMIKMGKKKMMDGGKYKISDVISSKELSSSYPELMDRTIVFFNDAPHKRGWYDPSTGDIGININKDGFSQGSMIKDIKRTLTHELQHSIQGIEGFAKGTSPLEAGSFPKYLATHGEVEARGLTKGEVGTNPSELYDKEYNSIMGYDPFESVDDLKKNVVNKRGVPVGSDKRPEVINF